jgi:hypothetical protein
MGRLIDSQSPAIIGGFENRAEAGVNGQTLILNSAAP